MSPKSTYTYDDFIRDATAIFGSLYGYGKVEFKTRESKIIIICSTHGDFQKTVYRHIVQKEGCPKCIRESKRYTTEIYVEKCDIVHKYKYDYSLTVYVNANTKIIVICPTHGEFYPKAGNHIAGSGCPHPECRNNKTIEKQIVTRGKQLSKDNFIERCEEVHGLRYGYLEAIFNGRHGLIIIFCSIHGNFEQKLFNHLAGHGCHLCGIESRSQKNRLTLDEFKIKANFIHDGLYGYDKVVYENYDTPIIICCKEHGDFLQTPASHLAGNGCKKCSGIFTYTQEEYLLQCGIIHNHRYGYESVVYVNNSSIITIHCNKHGNFEQNARVHMIGHGCSQCGHEKVGLSRRTPLLKMIELFTEVHGLRYDYSLVVHTEFHNKVIIICRVHGKFEQTPHHHLYGQCNCPQCVIPMSKGERQIEKILMNLEITYETQKKFDDCKNIFCLPFDFHISDRNLLIEYDGEQHFKPIEFFGGEESFEKRKKNDEIKNKYCRDNNIELLRIRFDEDVEEKLVTYFNF